jgi:hypothetical protein
MIDPTKVLIATPSYDGKVECGYAGGLAACASAHLFGNMVFLASVSHVGLARNMMAHGFMRNKDFEWLVFIDADIAFSADDFKLLLDYPPHENAPAQEGVSVNEQGEALIVTAEYARKQEDLSPARFGLGFTRIHRSVFEKLDEFRLDDNGSLINQFFHKGDMVSDYFISGAIEAQHWRGEDTGFFLQCRLAGITPRIEQRTQLIHIGRKTYAYLPPVTGIA